MDQLCQTKNIRILDIIGENNRFDSLEDSHTIPAKYKNGDKLDGNKLIAVVARILCERKCTLKEIPGLV